MKTVVSIILLSGFAAALALGHFGSDTLPKEGSAAGECESKESCGGEGGDSAGMQLASYFATQEALASDDFAAARTAASGLVKDCGEGGYCENELNAAAAIAEAPGIGAARLAFKDWSDAVISKAKEGGLLMTAAYEMSCPMALDNAGASWLQSTASLRNPYFGASMLMCGMHTASYAADSGGKDECCGSKECESEKDECCGDKECDSEKGACADKADCEGKDSCESDYADSDACKKCCGGGESCKKCCGEQGSCKSCCGSEEGESYTANDAGSCGSDKECSSDKSDCGEAKDCGDDGAASDSEAAQQTA